MKRFAVIAAVGLVVAGCGSSGARVSTPPYHQTSRYPVVVHSPVFRGVRPSPVQPVTCVCTNISVSPPPVFAIRSAAMLLSPTSLRIVTLGSSSCPSVPDKLVVESPHTIEVHLTTGSRADGQIVPYPPAGGACTADFGATSMLVAIDPSEIDVHSPLTVRFFYEGRKKPEVRTAAPLARYPVVIHSPLVVPIPRAERGHLGIYRRWKLVSPTRLGIMTMGSHSCVTVPSELTILGRNRIRIDFAQGFFRNGRAVTYSGSHGCTLDISSARMLVAIDPELIDVHRPLTVEGIYVRGSKTPGVVTVAPLKS